MINLIEELIEALREELQEYGALLGLLDTQQELIVRRAAGDILNSVELVNGQVEVIKGARASRAARQQALAACLELPASTKLSDLIEQLPAKYQPLAQALLDENNRLLHRVQRRTQQNHILLSHSLDLLQRLVNSLTRETVGPVYTADKRVARLPAAGNVFYEAVG